MTATLLLVIIALIGLLLWSEWRFGQLREAARQLGDIVDNGRFGDRIRAPGGAPAELAADANRLLAQMGIQELIIRERDRALGGVLTSLSEPIAIHREGIEFANERFVALLTASTDTPIIGRSLADLVAPDYAEILREYLRRSLAGELGCEELQVELGGATKATPMLLTQARIDYRGGPALLLTLARVMPAAPAIIERRMPSTHETLECISEAVITTDSGGSIDYINSAAQQILGVTANEAYGRSIRDFLNLIDELDAEPLEDPVAQCLAAQAQITVGRGALLVTAADTQPHAIELTVSPLINRGIMVGAVVVWRDVSEVRGITQQMTYQATHDPLTGLVNRREFERRVQEALSRAPTGTVGHVLCFLDLDRFKAVNDSCGHEAGDNMLREVATLLRACVRDSDTVGRLGGDEFGLLLAGCSLDRALEIAEGVLQRLRDYSFVWTDKIFDIGVSIGAVEITGQDMTLDELMSTADGACYVAKQRGNHVHVHSSRDAARRPVRSDEDHWLPRLKNALADDRFELLLQPIMPVSAASPLKGGPALEVLLRMQDERTPEGISPLQFQRTAERHKLMSDIDCWVVERAVNALAEGEILLPRHRSLAINIAGQTLGNPQFLEFVVDCFDRTGVRPEQVCFEVTENSVITNIGHSRRFINVLHGLGVHFALDDFGRGLSSFGNLKNLELNYLKIDGSFIRNLGTEPVNQAIVAAMLDLARTLNFRVVAEHVEDQRVLDTVRKMGVDYVQGFQIGHPKPLVQVADDSWKLNRLRLG